MLNRKSIKLSDYIEYPFLIPRIDLDFDIGKDFVVIKSLMTIVPRSGKPTRLVLQGQKININ